MNDFLESNLQAKNQPVKKDYYSAEAEAFVRTPSVYVQLHVRMNFFTLMFFNFY